jgi:hypothetical protein
MPEISVQDATASVSPTVVRKLITHCMLPAKHIVTTAPCVIRAQDLARTHVQQYVAAVHRGQGGPGIDDAEQQLSTTQRHSEGKQYVTQSGGPEKIAFFPSLTSSGPK